MISVPPGSIISSSPPEHAALLHDLLIYGICPGIGSVLSFVPLIAVLFCLLAILEDCGYFSYAAALFDSGMSRLGLSGQCIVPLIMGFGCAVPAVMSASSMLEGNKKLRTIFMIPFMSCSARLPVYSVLISAFFEDHRAIVVWFIYLTGITTAMICAGLAGKIADGRRPNNLSSSNCRCQRGSGYSAGHKTRTGGGHFTTPSLTPPRISYVLDVVLTNSLGFVKKAFSIILAASVVIWFLQSFDCGFHMVSDCRESMLVFLGRSVAPFFEPLGFGSWQAASAMIAGLFAKEAIISTFSVIASSSGDVLVLTAQQHFHTCRRYFIHGLLSAIRSMYRHTGYRSKRDGQLALQHHNVFRPDTARMERVLRDLQYLQSSVSAKHHASPFSYLCRHFPLNTGKTVDTESRKRYSFDIEREADERLLP